MSKRVILAGLSLIALTACTVGPTFKQPAAPATASYAMTGDPTASPLASLSSSTDQKWWTAYGSDKLNSLVEQALTGNPTLDQADAALERVAELEKAQRGDSGPTANLSGLASRQRINTAGFGFSGFPSPTINVFSLGTSLRYNLDIFGGERRKDEAASARTEAQRQRTDAAYLNLTGAVVSRAVELAALRAQLATLDQIIHNDGETIAMIRRGI